MDKIKQSNAKVIVSTRNEITLCTDEEGDRLTYFSFLLH